MLHSNIFEWEFLLEPVRLKSGTYFMTHVTHANFIGKKVRVKNTGRELNWHLTLDAFELTTIANRWLSYSSYNIVHHPIDCMAGLLEFIGMEHSYPFLWLIDFLSFNKFNIFQVDFIWKYSHPKPDLLKWLCAKKIYYSI